MMNYEVKTRMQGVRGGKEGEKRISVNLGEKIIFEKEGGGAKISIICLIYTPAAPG